ncbi:MAG TPA: phosphopantetheine-binding protein [Gemmataceae bacterium]|nr:phosphopantetheine-binding protein [Gemmataceae bacterium]
MTDEAIYRDLRAVMARTFPDRDDPDDVSPSTTLFGDLGLASIDLVVLAEKLEAHYGRRLPFGSFLTGLRNRNATDVTLEELVAFLATNARG